MKLDDLDEVTKLRNHRAKAMKLVEACDGWPLDLKLGWSADAIDVASIISVMPIREAIKLHAMQAVTQYNVRLKSLGVEP